DPIVGRRRLGLHRHLDRPAPKVPTRARHLRATFTFIDRVNGERRKKIVGSLDVKGGRTRAVIGGSSPRKIRIALGIENAASGEGDSTGRHVDLLRCETQATITLLFLSTSKMSLSPLPALVISTGWLQVTP